MVNKALDEGITLFDTTDIYGNRGGSYDDARQRPATPSRDCRREQVRHGDGRRTI